MANIFDTYDDIQVKMALEHAVQSLGTVGAVQRDVYKTMVSLEDHDGPDMYSQYGLEWTPTEKTDKNGSEIWIHAVQQNPARISKQNASFMRDLTNRFNIDIRLGFSETIGNQLLRQFTQNVLFGAFNPRFISTNILKPENVAVINKTLDSLDRELHKIGWEIVKGGSNDNMSHLIGVERSTDLATGRQYGGSIMRSSAVLMNWIASLSRVRGTAIGNLYKSLAPGYALAGSLLQSIFSGYYHLSKGQLKAFNNRIVYFRDPTLLNLSGSNRKWGGFINPRISCLIKSIEPLKTSEGKTLIKKEPYHVDYYGVYNFQFGKITIFKETSSAVEGYDPMSLELIKTGWGHFGGTGETFSRLFEKTNITWANPEKYGVRKGELKVIKTKLGLNIKVGFGSHWWQNFKMYFKHSVLGGPQFFTPTFTSKNIEKRENVDLVNKALDEIDRQLRKYGWKVATVDDFEKLGADLFLAKREHFSAFLKTIYGVFWPTSGLSETVSNVLVPYFNTKNHNIYKNRMVYFRQANIIKGETKFEYGGLMHTRVGCHIISEKPIYDDKHGLHAFDFGKCTMFKSSDSNLD